MGVSDSIQRTAGSASLSESAVSIDLPAELCSQIQSLIAAGDFADEAAVIRAALGHLRHYRNEVAAIAEGLADAEAGRVIPLDESVAQIKSRHGLAALGGAF